MTTNERPKIVIVQGPTASGKTELAVRLAEAFDGEVVNADSVQVYRRMDIGTAKPDPEMRRRVRHHLLDVVEPDQNFSAADFTRLADLAISDIRSRGKNVFVVGGTGLYIRTLLGGLVDVPSGDEELRRRLDEELRSRGLEALRAELAAIDPETSERLHPNDRVRILRALEIWRLTGTRPSLLLAGHGFREERYDALKLGIAVDRDELYRRIEERVDVMMAAGLVGEVSALLSGGYDAGLKSMRSLGYRQIAAYLAGETDLEEAVFLIKRETRRYAKRQLTWFNKDFAITWFAYPANFATICSCVMQFLK